MPYKVFHEGEKYCVYKHDADGNKTGDSLGCHPSEAEANDQLAALYANEGKDVKVGARHSHTDQEHLQHIHDSAIALGAACPDERKYPQPKSLTDDDELVFFGSEVKALGDGKVGGYLVRFTTVDDPDLTGDYFTKDTDYDLEFPASSTVYYSHGMDTKIGRRKLGKATLTNDEFGVWADAQLNMSDQYEEFIYEMAKAGKLGWSSGTAGHLVEREPDSKASRITRWPLGLDASLTPTPAEPRNKVSTLKSLNIKTLSLGENDMTEQPIDIKSAVAEAVKAALAEQAAEAKAKAEKEAELKLAEDAGYKKAVEELTKKGYIKGTPAVVKELGSDPDGVKSFLHWVRTGQRNQGLIEAGSDWNIKAEAAYNITTGDSGEYLVPDPMLNRIIAKRDLQSFIRQTPAQVFNLAADEIDIPIEDTSMHAFTSTAEEGTYHENEGTFAQKSLNLTKYTKAVKMSEEFISDQAVNFDAWLSDALGRAEAVTENTLAQAVLVDGTGATEAGANFASGTAITIAELGALIGNLTDGYNTGTTECGFVMKNATKWYIAGLAAANYIPFNIWGYPVYVCDDMGAMTTGLTSVIFGNWTFFAVAQKPGMAIQRNPYLYMASGQIGLFASIRRAYDVLQSEAFYYEHQA